MSLAARTVVFIGLATFLSAQDFSEIKFDKLAHLATLAISSVSTHYCPQERF